MRNPNSIEWGVVMIATLLTATRGTAGEATYTDRNSWLASLEGGAPDFTQDFNTTGSDTHFNGVDSPGTNPTDFTYFSIGGDIPHPTGNLVDVPGFAFPDKNVNGTSYANVFVEFGINQEVSLTLSTPAAAWGADFRLTEENEGTIVELRDPSDLLIATLDIDPIGTIPRFWGFTTDHGNKVQKLVFKAKTSDGMSGGEVFGIDDISAAKNLSVLDSIPTIFLTSAPSVGVDQTATNSYQLTITYADDKVIDTASLDPSDILISGSGGTLTVNSATPNRATSGTPRIVTYQCSPPGGSWDFPDNGVYTVAVNGTQVADNIGQFVAANAVLTTFSVNVSSLVARSYNNMSVFESAIGGASSLEFTVDFEDFTTDNEFSAGPISAPKFGSTLFTLEQMGSEIGTGNLVDDVTPSGIAFGGIPVDGSNYAYMLTDASTSQSVDLIFETPVAAWGAMLEGAIDEEDLEIDLYDTSDILVDSLEVEKDGFFGFTTASPGAIKRLVFRSASKGPSNNRFGMDNVKGAYTYTAPTNPLISDVSTTDVTLSDTGTTSYSFTIEYSDDSAIEVNSLDINDVSISGPAGTGTLTILNANVTSNTNGTHKEVTYIITPPGGSWDLTDNGTYTIGVLENEIKDDTGNFVTGNPALATFTVETRSGAATTFDSNSAWTAAIGGTADWSEDFEGFFNQDDFSTASAVSPGNFTLGQNAGSSTFGNFIDVTAGIQIGEVTGSPINYAALFVEADQGLTVEILFEQATLGFIGEFFIATDEEELEIEIHDVNGIIDLLEVNANGYFGFTLPTPTASKLVFRGATPNLLSRGELFGLDNLRGHQSILGPEIDVQGQGISIASGNTPTILDDTTFGSLECGNALSVIHTFTIHNTGGVNLNLMGSPAVQLSSGSPDFSVTSQPGLTSIPSPTGTTTFDITFRPSSIGTKTAAFSIANDDEENPYIMNVTGIGTDTAAPVITLLGDNPQVIEPPNAYIELGATAIDTCDLSLGLISIDASSVNTMIPGSYLVTYNISDTSGNAATELTRTVLVQDNSPPVINLGEINFSNISGPVKAPVSLQETGEPLGPGWWAQLWGNQIDIDLQAISEPTEFVSDGWFFGGIVTVDIVPPGESGFFQVAVWEGPATSLIQAQTDGLLWGFSNQFFSPTSGHTKEGSPPSPPSNLEGLEPFAIQSQNNNSHVGDFVWSDLNRNGLQDDGEPGVSGVQIAILDCETSEVIEVMNSDADGRWQLQENIPASSYLEVTLPAGFGFTAWAVGDNGAIDSDIDPLTGRSQCIVAECGAEDTVCVSTNIDIGLTPHPVLPPVPDVLPLDPDSTPTDPPESTDSPNGPQATTSAVHVSGPGFWKRHPGSWPIADISIGGISYSRSEAVPLISNGADKSLTMFRQVISTKLNLARGADASCIEEILAKADEWLSVHGQPPSNVAPNSQAWADGEPLAKSLARFNNGHACAPPEHESLSPVEVSVGFNAQEDRSDNFRIRIKGQPGRSFILQKTNDFTNWEDLLVIENAFGISEALAKGTVADPNAFFRIVPEHGPAKKPKPKQNKIGTFMEVKANQSVALEPIVFVGDLIVAGAKNTIIGSTLDADRYTVIAGNLEIRGTNNTVSNLTVLGDVILRGNKNTLTNVDYQSEVIQAGGSENNVF